MKLQVWNDSASHARARSQIVKRTAVRRDISETCERLVAHGYDR
jgi:hypothetical protein